jgi:hypothetical protein
VPTKPVRQERAEQARAERARAEQARAAGRTVAVQGMVHVAAVQAVMQAQVDTRATREAPEMAGKAVRSTWSNAASMAS